MPEKKPFKLSTLLGSIAFLAALIAVTFYIIFKDSSLNEIMGAVKTTNAAWLIVGVGLMYVSIACQAWAIYVSFRRLGQRVPFIKCLGYAFTGVYFSAITPFNMGGQPVQMYYMVRDGINLSYVTLTMLLTNVAYQFVVIFYAFFMFILRFGFVIQNVSGMWGLVLYGVVANFAVIIALIFMFFSKSFAEKVCKWAVGIGVKLHIVKNCEAALAKVDKQISEYRAGANEIRNNPRLIIYIVVITVLQMSSLYLIPYAVYKGFGLGGISAFDILALQAVLYVAVSFVPLPGAVGVTETAFVGIFAALFGQLVIPGMLVSRAINFYSVLFVSGAVSLIIYIRHRRIVQNENAEVSAGNGGVAQLPKINDGE